MACALLRVGCDLREALVYPCRFDGASIRYAASARSGCSKRIVSPSSCTTPAANASSSAPVWTRRPRRSRRLGHRRRRFERVPRLWWQCREPILENGVDAVRQGELCAHGAGLAGLAHRRAGQLQRVVGVAAGEPGEPDERRPRKALTKPALEQPVERVRLERAHADSHEPLRAEPHVGRVRPGGRSACREQHDGLILQPPEREAERGAEAGSSH